MIDYDLEDGLSSFLRDPKKFFEEFNNSVPANLEIDHEDRPWMCVAFFLARILDSLKNIEDAADLRRAKEIYR
ncbi:MAG: hypothetical protein SRB2_00355 [Desulfobacteraceae bacterium Eth-SRB2]|nr:MAG: hypothetical protein SRB2_00355 [Desulfobacteraceae bacterium Eth-SRB2]